MHDNPVPDGQTGRRTGVTDSGTGTGRPRRTRRQPTSSLNSEGATG